MAKQPKDPMAQIGKMRVRVPEHVQTGPHTDVSVPSGSPDLSWITAADLLRELQVRKERMEQQLLADCKRRQDVALHNVDTLLVFTPYHQTNECSDTASRFGATTYQGKPRCNRCFLLNAKSGDHWDTDVDVDLRLSPSPSYRKDEESR